MASSIVSIGLANPGAPIAQASIADFMKKAHQLDELESRKLGFLYRKSGIDTRYSVLDDFEKSGSSEFTFFPKSEDFEPFPGTKARMDVFSKTAADLCETAARSCLSKPKTHTSEVSHLILVSCTGMMAPGVELQLMERLGLQDSVERYCVHFMGCYAAFTGLKLADKIVLAEPEAKVLLVSVELCTLHFQKEYSEDNVLANSLFGDGAAAALVMNSEQGMKMQSYQSNVLREGEADMAWGIGDFGFEMRLSKYIPTLLDKGIQQLLEKFEHKYQLSTLKHFAIHPGGKQILQKVKEAFQLPDSANTHALEVLSKFGNMSSSTILFVLHSMMEDPAIQGKILAMGFGPGLTLETLLLDKQ
ncbi:type III polyketide synthase [Algoriphagus halophytocola]|uniref:Type III polyketide synthase n=1 Tax=Algoriphagus halophytocola TaxID=2991499 RepID=A0ABY6MH68_9BACT|nr:MULTISPECIES: type III polyketide synthase [unclassified Algoriphagus]UZD21757.1 type III polyketide synthase [Algoriphagus sp. TR-M5]WBL42969.1 type III polyketide synthase [Algoriphagus sp. TR-M9]